MLLTEAVKQCIVLSGPYGVCVCVCVCPITENGNYLSEIYVFM